MIWAGLQCIQFGEMKKTLKKRVCPGFKGAGKPSDSGHNWLQPAAQLPAVHISPAWKGVVNHR
jgi:hypothetical protein